MNYPRVRDTKHEPSYYGAGYGLCMAVNLDLGDTTKVNYFSSRMGYGASNYYGTRYEGPCTGTGAIMRGAIWLSQPTNNTWDSPDFISTNTVDVEDGGYLPGNGKGSSGTSIIFNNFTWYFDNADCGQSDVWVGWVHDRYRDGKQTCVAFATTSSDSYTRKSYNQGMTTTSLRFGFTDFSASEPYTAPSIGSLSISPKIGIYKSQSFTYSWSMSKGTNNLDWVHLDAYNDGTDTCVDWKNVGTGFGNRSEGFVFGNGQSGGGTTGKKYQGMVALHDGKNRFTTNKVDFYTYTKPTMNASVSSSKFSPQDNAKISWTTNQRVHQDNNLEKVFATTCKLNGNTLTIDNQGTSGSVTLNSTIINNSYSDTERSVKSISGSATITRTNVSAGDYSASSTPTFTIQYQPVLAPTSVSKKVNGNDLPSKIIIQDSPTINMSWGYQLNSGGAGVVSGYYVEIFTTSDYSGTPYKTFTVSGSSSASKNLATATDLKRGKMNYVKITPFYKCPDTSKTASYIDANHNIRGTQSYKAQLCTPIARINTPEIAYPVNNSTWHNKYFRILLELPEDPDLTELTEDRTITSEDAYRYKEIQLEITYPDNTTIITYNTSTKIIWSTDVFSHKKRIAICPALSSLDDVAKYKMRIRVQKNYYITTGDESWSKWSNYVVVNKKAVERQTYTKGQKIMASHYMNPRTASVNCHGVYPIHALPLNNVERIAGNEIEHKHYKAIYDTILQIKNDVNGYCTYDRSSVSFTREIKDFTEKPPKVEYITAADSDSIVSANDGRNYMNLLVDDLKLLY